MALTINITYDASIIGSSHETEYKAAITEAVTFIKNTYPNINATFGLSFAWNVLGGGTVGTNTPQYFSTTYANWRTAIIAAAASPNAISALNSFPAVDPNIAGFFVLRINCIALGLTTTSGIDSTIILNSTKNFSWTQSSPIATGTFDAVGVLLHEMTEVMGRYRQSSGNPGLHSPLDLLSYSAPGVREWNYNPCYFSFNQGTTIVNNFNANGSFDSMDWTGTTTNQYTTPIDTFNATLTTGVLSPFSLGDGIVMEVLGFGLPRRSKQLPGIEAPDGSRYGTVTDGVGSLALIKTSTTGLKQLGGEFAPDGSKYTTLTDGNGFLV